MASQSPFKNPIPQGTAPKTESGILDALKAVNVRNFDTLKDVTLGGLSGEPIDDKTYLMERIIQLTAELPLHDRISDTLTNTLLNELWTDLDHPANSYLGYDFAFRQADGRNNNVLWPHIGKAGMPYARSVRPRKMQPPRPDPGLIYDSVLRREDSKFRAHPNKISSVLFYVASIIIHDCFHTSHEDYAISETSSYLDLSPLYGSTLEQQLAMRMMKDGKLKADCFSDVRIFGFPPGVGVLLIMFNRFHNHVVENLAKIDENGRFSQIKNSDPKSQRRTGLTEKDTKRTPEELYDEALFQTGRLVTTGLYVNIILQDYVRTILGLNRVDSLWNLDPRQDYSKAFMKHKIPEAQGNQVSAEFSLVYRWHSCVSERDTIWTEAFLKDITSKGDMNAAVTWVDGLKDVPPEKRKFDKLERLADGRFSDEDLSQIWSDSVEDVAGAFGAANVPVALRFVEILSMNQARSWNLASLNEFREYFKLEPHKTFESINPDPKIAHQLEKLYGHPDNVEIYPGIVVESAKKPMAPGSGLCASWTTSRAILADAVSLVRSDRFHTVDYTPRNLTNWGYNASNYDLDINHGGVFYKLVLNAFPHVSKNSVYAHFPLVNPPENRVILKGMGRAKFYSFDQPQLRPKPINVKASTDLAVSALTNSSEFTSAWAQRSAAFGVYEPTNTDAEANLSFAEALMMKKDWKDTVTKFYTSRLTKLWQENQYDLAGFQTIDVIADVLNPTHLGFILAVLGIDSSDNEEFHKSHDLLGVFGHLFEHAYSPNPQPRGLNTAVRDVLHFAASGIASLFGSVDSDSSKVTQLGQLAINKLKEVNGTNAQETAWRDILPTAALVLTTISRSSASVVESSVPKFKQASSTETTSPNPAKLSHSTIAIRATTSTGKVEAGQLVVVNLADVHDQGETKKFGPEVVFTQQLAEIANKAILNIIKSVGKIETLPGPQGSIKKIETGGNIMYLNETECDYVTYPVSLKVRWKK